MIQSIRADARGAAVAPGPNDLVRLDCSRALFGVRVFVSCDVAANVDVYVDAGGPRSVIATSALAAVAATSYYIPAPAGWVSVRVTTTAAGRASASVLALEPQANGYA
jgi:hypothetical protein